jgi:hypothetical protein
MLIYLLHSVAIISIIRIKELLAVDFEDITWSLPGGLEWTCLEESIALINANLPFLRSIIKHMTPKAFSAQWASNQQSRRTNTRKTDKSIGDDTEGTFSLVDKSTSSQYMELPDYGTGHSVHSQSGQSRHSWVLLANMESQRVLLWINLLCFSRVLYTYTRVKRTNGLLQP